MKDRIRRFLFASANRYFEQGRDERHSSNSNIKHCLGALITESQERARSSRACKKEGSMSKKKPNVTIPGKVEKIIKPRYSGETEKAQIAVDGADDLYRELRIENSLTDENGDKVQLKENAEVDVVVEADGDATEPKSKEGELSQNRS
jgi:hypothetical protein